ncbi:class I SAM-dependent methyltransferase [Raoultibacter phocaeensis]|uniref:class I SAM-dependent methyltransferase n=1 Tax=Raoultibacter phocaeensis TaxID=2479841 RepID=UPI001118B92A|nr:class I SAM-dependent methyltransferase [Raoultibacter phocaeensis]
METHHPIDERILKEHYERLPQEYGFASQCKMVLLGDLKHKRVLDIDCRRGKGVVKLSDYVGARGHVVGVDPNPEWIAVAESFMEDAWRRNGLPENNMEFRHAYPEDLASAGLADSSFDLVFANSSIALDYSPEMIVREVFRVLRPGGVFVFDGVVAESLRDADTLAWARAIGNAVQAAFYRKAFEQMVADVGFDRPEYYEESDVRPETGSADGIEVPVAETGEEVRFVKTTARICKPRR